MDKQLSDALTEIIKAGKDGVVNMGLFVQQQAPDLAKEIISWGFWVSIAEIFIEAFVMYICFLGFNWSKKASEDDDSNPFPFLLCIFGGILFAIMFVCFCNSIETVIKCLVAPKLYLIDYVKDLLTPSKG